MKNLLCTLLIGAISLFTASAVHAVSIATVTAAGASSSVAWPGGEGTITFTGTFDSAYASVEYSADGGTTWRNLFPANPAVTFDATTDTKTLIIPAGSLRIYVYNAGASTSVTFNCEPIGLPNPAIGGIAAMGVHTWAGGAAATDSISVDGLVATDVVLVNISVRGSANPTSVIGVNDAANDQIDLVMDQNGEDDVTEISYAVLRPSS